MTTILGYQPADWDRVRILAAEPEVNQPYVGMSGKARVSSGGLFISLDDKPVDECGRTLSSVRFMHDSVITLEKAQP
jgi:hypothetical protein